jgi:hypothetical protein
MGGNKKNKTTKEPDNDDAQQQKNAGNAAFQAGKYD